MDTPDGHTQRDQGSHISAAVCQTSERSREASKRVALICWEIRLLQEGSDDTGTEKGGRNGWHACWSSCRSWSVGRRWCRDNTSASWIGGPGWVVTGWSDGGAALWLPVDILGACWWSGAAVALGLPVDVLRAHWDWGSAAALRLPVNVLRADNWNHAALRLPVDVLGALHHVRRCRWCGRGYWSRRNRCGRAGVHSRACRCSSR